MKFLRTGLVAIVALLTINVTIVVYASTFNSPKVTSGACDPNIDVEVADFLLSNYTPLTNPICSATLPLYADNPIFQVADQYFCSGSLEVFCCAEVLADNHFPATDQLRVTKTICGEYD